MKKEKVKQGKRQWVCMLSCFSRLQLFVDCCPPGSSVQGDSLGNSIGVGCHALRQGFSQPSDRTCISCVCCFVRWVLHH